jgi:4-diphosphocytidyl-2-C-methyl-D-erythritol kinase
MGIQSGTVTAIEACSPAKLNLFLHVTGRRPDGYHLLQTVFQLLNWGDDMRFENRPEPGVTLSGDTDDIAPEQNLIFRAAQSLGQSGRGAHIHIRKRIPRGGGLGGGSSNAATTLLALNRLWGLALEQDVLQQLAASLGADVPVFVMGQSAWAEGVGEVLSALSLPKRWYIVAQPGCHTAPITVQAFFSGAGHNDLQDVVLPRYPEVQQAWEWLYQHSPTARMTGSGACVFAALETEESARRIAAEAPNGLTVVVAEGVDRLPEMRVVD